MLTVSWAQFTIGFSIAHRAFVKEVTPMIILWLVFLIFSNLNLNVILLILKGKFNCIESQYNVVYQWLKKDL